MKMDASSTSANQVSVPGHLELSLTSLTESLSKVAQLLRTQVVFIFLAPLWDFFFLLCRATLRTAQ
jgi:hypothetical protein